MLIALIAGAALSLAVGLAPATTFDLLRLDLHPHGFTSANVVFGLEIFVFTLVVSWALLPWLAPRNFVALDTDWFYRKAGKPVEVLIQRPLEWPFSQAAQVMSKIVIFAHRISLAPELGWARLLSLRGEPATIINQLGRPPLGAAVVAISLTFAAVILLAAVFQ